MNDSEVFEALVPLLVDEIPKRIAALKLNQPIFRLRIYYFDPHEPRTYLLLVPALESDRCELAQRLGHISRTQLWFGEDGSNALKVELRDPPPISKLFDQVYKLLDETESLCMVQFRAMLHRVAWRLNRFEWSKVCSVTDDFFVLPQDGSAHFDNGWPDVERSIPPERLELLRSKGYGPPDWWQELPTE